MRGLFTPPPPPPMAEVAGAREHVEDARAALKRAAEAWNEVQLRDAIRSARLFLDEAEASIRTKDSK